MCVCVCVCVSVSVKCEGRRGYIYGANDEHSAVEETHPPSIALTPPPPPPLIPPPLSLPSHTSSFPLTHSSLLPSFPLSLLPSHLLLPPSVSPPPPSNLCVSRVYMNVTLDHYKKVEEEHELYCKMTCVGSLIPSPCGNEASVWGCCFAQEHQQL